MSKKDYFIIFCSLVVLGFSGSYLFLDYNPFAFIYSEEGKTIGYISTIEKDVRRKRSGSLVWENIKGERPLFAKDSVYTGANSSVNIVLPERSNLTLDENSLVVFNEEDLELKGGTIRFKLNGFKKLKLFINGSKREISNKVAFDSNFELSLDDSGKLSLNVLEGNLNYKNNKASKDVSIGQGIEQLKDEKIVRYEKKGARLGSPAQNSLIVLDEANDIQFNWEKIKAVDSYRLELSKDKNFIKTLKKLNINKNDANLDLRSYGKGNLFWRVSHDLNGKKYFSKTNKITLKAMSAPVLIFPERKAILDFAFNLMNFRWQYLGENADFVIEVKLDKKEKTQTRTYRTNNKEKSVNLGKAGAYLWRVGVLGKSEEVVKYSRFQSFTIKKKSKVFLYSRPQNGKVFNIFKDKKTVDFKFSESEKYMKESGKYQIEIIEVDSDKKIKSKVYGRNRVRIDLPPGSYRWFLKDLSNKRDLVSKYDMGSLKINKLEIIKPPFDLSFRVQNMASFHFCSMNFSWKSFEKYGPVKLEVVDDKNKILIKKTLRDNKFSLKTPKPMNGKFRVIQNYKGKQVISAWKDFSNSSFFKKHSIILKSPDSGQTYKSSNGTISFSWISKFNSKNFRLRLFDRKNENVVLQKKTSSATVKINTPRAGEYLWQVEDLSDKNNFIKESPKRLILVKRKELKKSTPKEKDEKEILPLAF